MIWNDVECHMEARVGHLNIWYRYFMEPGMKQDVETDRPIEDGKRD